jgi:hypothetical protein
MVEHCCKFFPVAEYRTGSSYWKLLLIPEGSFKIADN